jgi:nucleotide-binding universal stress UspA family protein
MTEIAASPFSHILVGVDGSDGSARALEWVAAVVANTDAKVTAAHILTYDYEFGRDLTLDTMRLWRRELEDDLHTRWTEPLRAANVPHTCIVFEAESRLKGLIELANREGADLVIIGADGRAHLTGRVAGGLGDRLVRHVRLPVVIVPSTSMRRLRCENEGS